MTKAKDDKIKALTAQVEQLTQTNQRMGQVQLELKVRLRVVEDMLGSATGATIDARTTVGLAQVQAEQAGGGKP